MLTLIISIILITEIFDLFIDYLDYKHWTPKIPKPLQAFVDKEKYKKSQEYNKTKQRFDFATSIFSVFVIVGALALGFFGYLDSWLTSQFPDNSTLVTLLFFGICFILNDLLSIPFDIYDTFKIEEKYGFNKTTPTTFIWDKLKGYVLTAVIGGAVLYLFKLYFDFAGELFWLYAWITVTVVSVFFNIFYTNLIIPIFNKLKPLEKGVLRTEIEDYSKSVDFPLDKIMVMDASKRTTKGNAFFSGLFGKKNIVLFDTIIEKHPVKELVAVLAHEVGHFRKKHTLQLMLLGMIQTAIMLYLLGIFINNPVFSQALGAQQTKFHLGLIAFTLLYTPISLIIGIGMNIISRKFEFEADAFGRSTYNGKKLAEALKRLSLDTLSNLNPHPAYVFVNYGHPPVVERIKRLER